VSLLRFCSSAEFLFWKYKSNSRFNDARARARCSLVGPSSCSITDRRGLYHHSNRLERRIVHKVRIEQPDECLQNISTSFRVGVSCSIVNNGPKRLFGYEDSNDSSATRSTIQEETLLTFAKLPKAAVEHPYGEYRRGCLDKTQKDLGRHALDIVAVVSEMVNGSSRYVFDILPIPCRGRFRWLVSVFSWEAGDR
jgi:hypothetical protein